MTTPKISVRKHETGFRAHCPAPGCQSFFDKETETKASMAAQMHHARKHGGMKPHHPVNRYTMARAQTETVKARKKYTRRAKPVPASVTINFCPCCGFDIRAVALGVALSQKP